MTMPQGFGEIFREGRKHQPNARTSAEWDAAMREAEMADDSGTAGDDPSEGVEGGVSLADFRAYMPMHNYIFCASREFWPASSVNARIPPVPLMDAEGKPVLDKKGNPETQPANAWLDQHHPVEQMTWAPGEPMLIRDRLVSEGGWIDRQGCVVFNLYKPPVIIPGDARRAGPWLELVRRVFPDDADHIVQWLAHRVQRPEEKINHALVFGGAPGIGKDTILAPIRHAIGPWNFSEVSPGQLLGRFNGFIKSVILRISEARDLGDVDRFAFYDHTKVYCAAPPDVLRVDEKHVREHAVMNVCGVIITTNYKTDGIYLPADDRRHFVAWSDATKEDFTAEYWDGIYDWFQAGGHGHVAAYLAALDLSGFNPKAPPPKTPAFWAIVTANQSPETGEMADAIELLRNPNALTIPQIIAAAGESSFGEFLQDRRNYRQIPHRLEGAGYVAVPKPHTENGRWTVNRKRQVIYAKKNLSIRDRIAAATELERG